MISTILSPNLFLGNSLNYLKPLDFDGQEYHRRPFDETMFMCGIFNSFCIDFILRHKVATNMNIFYLMQLPIPKYDKNNIYHWKIVENTAKLICTTDDFKILRKELNIFKFETQKDKRLALESQINAFVAKIYNLNKTDLKFMLSTFPIVSDDLKEFTLDEFLRIQ